MGGRVRDTIISDLACCCGLGSLEGGPTAPSPSHESLCQPHTHSCPSVRGELSSLAVGARLFSHPRPPSHPGPSSREPEALGLDELQEALCRHPQTKPCLPWCPKSPPPPYDIPPRPLGPCSTSHSPLTLYFSLTPCYNPLRLSSQGAGAQRGCLSAQHHTAEEAKPLPPHPGNSHQRGAMAVILAQLHTPPA